MRNHFIDHPLLGGLIQRALRWIGHAVVINAQGAMEGRAVVLAVAAVGIICHTVEYFECQCLIDIILSQPNIDSHCRDPATEIHGCV